MTLGSRGEYLYFPALRPDADGNISVVFTASSADTYAGVRITGRLAADRLNRLQAVSEIKSGAGAQTIVDETLPGGIQVGRMGDYSGAAVDPSDPHFVWVMGEYIRSTVEPQGQDWGSWVAQLQPLPSLLLSLNLDPPKYQQGQTLILTATVTPWPTLTTADVYVAVQLPDLSLLYLLSDGTLSQTQQPFVSNWTITAVDGPIFSYTFTGTEPTGNYTWLGAFAEAGSQPPNFKGGIYSAPFTFGIP